MENRPMDVYALVATARAPENQLRFDPAEFERNVLAAEAARQTWRRRIAAMVRLVLRGADRTGRLPVQKAS